MTSPKATSATVLMRAAQAGHEQCGNADDQEGQPDRGRGGARTSSSPASTVPWISRTVNNPIRIQGRLPWRIQGISGSSRKPTISTGAT